VIHATNLEDLWWDVPTPILGMGTMDGIHLGHQEILRRVRECAEEVGGTPGVITFARHPLEVVRPSQAPPLITPLPVKLALLDRLGMAATAAIEFSPAMAKLTAEAFVQRVLVEGLKIAGLCVGYDFRFGRERRGDTDFLRALAWEYRFWLEVVPPVSVDGLVVSSRMIRALLAEGNVEEARRFLGRPYCLAGEVQPGAGRGGELGFATANIPAPAYTPLREGVYAGRLLVRGVFHDALLNLGRAPTFGEGERRLEVHIPGWKVPLYGEQVTAYFLERLRDERRFPSPDALVAQLARDGKAAEAAWEAAHGLPWPEWALHS